MEGVKVGGRNITNSRYADDTFLIANSQENLQALLSVVTYESEKRKSRLSMKSPPSVLVTEPPDISIPLMATHTPGQGVVCKAPKANPMLKSASESFMHSGWNEPVMTTF
ncbi:catenin (Cadherin-associated protein), alpha 3 [Elysia marginata]|uniref:Catenin (Cadherin-associated protein), alpha 3 n=1 Tax=Elysia marginata TaxID=1093978 RepID=A0AAV4JVP5_9GAST|nr:catenin (Cadherin-associated protein), alpha 3 [Elysia marginata]